MIDVCTDFMHGTLRDLAEVGKMQPRATVRRYGRMPRPARWHEMTRDVGDVRRMATHNPATTDLSFASSERVFVALELALHWP